MPDFRHVFHRRPQRRTIALRLNREGVLEILAPKILSESAQLELLVRHRNWIERSLVRHSAKQIINPGEPLQVMRSRAQILVRQKVEHYNNFYNHSFGAIRIMTSKTRWGSCSSRKNLCFNYQVAALPEHLLDYIVVHELCHLREMNHSSRFWDLVALQVPDHKQRRRDLRGLIVS